jgi:hypothetical protein
MYEYSLNRFYKDLKRSLERIKTRKLNYRVISKNFLGMRSKWHINDKILHSKRCPNYIIPWNLISKYENRLKKNLEPTEYLIIKPLFHKLRKLKRNIPFNKQYVKIDYFKSLEDKKKAYFYGWLFADGHLETSHGRLMIDIDVKDGEIMKRFTNAIEINPTKVFYKRRYKNKKLCRFLVLTIKSKRFASNLYKKGFPIGKKSEKIRFPQCFVEKRELALAFLLGYFDGDGSHGRAYPVDLKKNERKFLRPYIKSNSIEFLKDIKSIFNIPYKISKKTDLNLGSDLYKEMLKNYKFSLERKRYNGYYTKKEIYKFRINNLRPQWSKSWRWFKISKDELKSLWEKGWTDIRIADYHLKKYNIAIKKRTVAEWRKKWKLFHTDPKFRNAKKRLIIKELLPLKEWSLKKIYTEKFGYKFDHLNSKHRYMFKKRLKKWFEGEEINKESDIINFFDKK